MESKTTGLLNRPDTAQGNSSNGNIAQRDKID
jgi:hypothetical protein